MLDLDLTARGEEGRSPPEKGHRRRGLWLWRSTTTAPVTSWRWERADDVLVDVARMGVRSTSSISSCCGGKELLEIRVSIGEVMGVACAMFM
jgi:hypothetical protein